jgi:hypothetical protein
MGKQAPAAPDYQGAAQKTGEASAASVAGQTQANRPDVTTPFSSTNWSQDGAGNWSMNQSLSPEAQSAYGAMKPFDFGQFGQVGTGDEARKQATDAAYAQSTSRLNPQWAQREESQRAQLANQGLDPNSEAARGANAQLAAGRNDAYGSAMNSAISQGREAGDSVFRNNMMGRQQAISEALRQRGMPLEDLRSMMGFTSQQPEFSRAGAAQTPDWLGATQAQGNYGLGAWNATNQANADAWGGGMQAAGGLVNMLPALFALSDERAKTDIVRLRAEALPGVPLATFRYRDAPGQLELGVIAQDLELVAPDLVSMRSDGMRVVDYAGLRRRMAR